MMNFDVLVAFQEHQNPCFALTERHIVRLRDSFPRQRVVWCRNRDSFVRALPEADVALTWEFRQEWFALAPRLRRIATPAAGRDFFPVTPPGSVEIRHGTFHGPLMGETLLGLMLGFNRRIFDAYRYQLEGRLWPNREIYHAPLLAGSHAMIVGFGHIGMTFGKMLKPLGVRITGVKRTPLETLPGWFTLEDRVVTVDRMDGLLPTVDHLILILPNDTGTTNLFGRERLSLLPEHAVVYNLGRGNCLDEEALAECLREGRLGGACLDVFAREPLESASPLSENLPGLVRLPHASAYSDVYMDRFLDEVIEWLEK